MPSVPNEKWRFKLRLFVSCDLVGSTAFKGLNRDSAWAETFQGFFREFPRHLQEQYADPPGKVPRVRKTLRTWKFSGDEILFCVELKKFTDVLAHLCAFKQALTAYPAAWTEKKIPLKLKGTAWLAGFPVTNREVTLEVEGRATKIIDYIGPSIDLGFRIAKFSDTRRFPLSADLALMLLDAVDRSETARQQFHLHLHGLEELKGVISGAPYPVFWIDMRDDRALLEERLMGLHRDFRPDDARDYLRAFIDSYIPHLRRPFIDGDKDERYGKIDPKLKKLRDKFESDDTMRGYTEEGERKAPPAKGKRKTPREPMLPVPIKSQQNPRGTRKS